MTEVFDEQFATSPMVLLILVERTAIFQPWKQRITIEANPARAERDAGAGAGCGSDWRRYCSPCSAQAD
ncbi:MAG: hypothetical protein WD403_06805, partial [Pirellulales bacterium]